MTMIAKVLCVEECHLLVCDCETHQEVIVHTDNACCFRRNECICIHYNGIMTASLPPQITATCIERYRTRGW